MSCFEPDTHIFSLICEYELSIRVVHFHGVIREVYLTKRQKFQARENRELAI